jgi:exodeoxyribonuclease VII large subunit
VEVDCGAAREWLARSAAQLSSRARAGVLQRARALASYSRAPRERVAAQQRELHQKARELRAASRRGLALRADYQYRIAAMVMDRKRQAALASASAGRTSLASRAAALDRASEALERRRRQALAAHAASIRAHDPERTLERGYAIALGPDGEPLGSAAALRDAQDFELRMADGSVPASVREGVER